MGRRGCGAGRGALAAGLWGGKADLGAGFELIEPRGEAEARQVYQPQAAAIDGIEAISREDGIDCDFKRLDGYLYRGPGTDPDVLERGIEACHRIGLTGVAWAERAPIPGPDTARTSRSTARRSAARPPRR